VADSAIGEPHLASLLEHATKPEADDRRAEEPRADEAEEERRTTGHRQMGLFGTAPRQVTGNFGDNSDYPKAMNKFTTDARSDEHRPLSMRPEMGRRWSCNTPASAFCTLGVSAVISSAL
jgi:hypothetical protein